MSIISSIFFGFQLCLGLNDQLYDYSTYLYRKFHCPSIEPRASFNSEPKGHLALQTSSH